MLVNFFEGQSAEATRKQLQLLRWLPPGAEVVSNPEKLPGASTQLSDGQEGEWIQRMVQAIVDGDSSCSTVQWVASFRNDPYKFGRSDCEEVFSCMVTNQAVSAQYQRNRRAQYAQNKKFYANRRENAATIPSGDWRRAY